VWLPKQGFTHLKQAIDLFLYESLETNAYPLVLRVMPLLDYLCMKEGGVAGGSVAIKAKVREHRLWKQEAVWRERFTAMHQAIDKEYVETIATKYE
jgi:hypothetical protein